MKTVEINWDRNIFDGEKRLLPKSKILYTQIHTLSQESWSVVIEFDAPPRDQGYTTIGKIRMLNEEESPDLLTPGFVFDFLDGPHKLGVCRVLEENLSVIQEIIDDLQELVEE